MKTACITTFGLLLSSLLSAQAAFAADTDELVKIFIGHCVLNAGRIDKTEAAATALEYEELSEEMAMALAPQDPNVEFKGWIVRDELSSPYALGISWSERDDEEISNCVVSSTNVDTEATLSALHVLIQFDEPRFDHEEAGQRYRIWGTDHITANSFITLIDANKLGIPGGTFSFSAPTEQ